MSWFLKAVCGSAGLTIGGPLGKISGAALKKFYSLNLIKPERFQELETQYLYKEFTEIESKQFLYFLTTFALLGKIVRADKKISKKELEAVEKIFRRSLKLTGIFLQYAKVVFNESKRTSFTPSNLAKQYYKAFPDTSDESLSFMIDIMFDVAIADSALHPNEITIIRRVAKAFHILSNEYPEVASRYSGKLKKNYSILGVQESDTKKEINSKRKKLVAKFDPKKIKSKGIPEELAKYARKKQEAVENAYEKITR